MRIIEGDGVKMANVKLPKISIIIRTKNEEKWIGYCLKSIFSQIVNVCLGILNIISILMLSNPTSLALL